MAELALGVAGLVIGIPGLLEVIVSLGDAVLRRIRHCKDDWKTLIDLVVTVNSSQTQEILMAVFDESNEAPDELKSELVQMFQALRNILERLVLLLPSAVDGKVKISASARKKVEAEVTKLEEWSDRFFKRALVFFLFGRRALPTSKPTNDSETESYESLAVRKVERLRDAVEQSLENTRGGTRQLLLNRPDEPDTRESIPHSSLVLSTPAGADAAHARHIIEYRTYSDDAREHEVKDLRKVVRDIAGILRHADPRLMGILHCDGFQYDQLQNRFELHFPFPQGLTNPRTLSDLLSDPSNPQVKHPLNQRISLAKSIVTAVFVLHSAGFVHKQIRPDNVVVFERKDRPEAQRWPYAIGTPFLVGFDNVRKVDAASLMLPVEDWEKSIYLSPERHRLQRGDEFRMQHDIFSIGVVLLEIAFWASFRDRRSELGGVVWKDARTLTLRAPEELKKKYIGLAARTVPRLMGQKYADAVVACLTGLESGDGSATDLEDADGIVVGTRYVMAIVKKLEEISM
ncbi:hypothetical protein MAPG_04785 [Magnaporthiopsis poae ATCC 64411]|uniref:Protein kinase domain-containing protein n=1 Tax=Magnaporthiopsis poae (strain ATCC 64411 / 73-15) TaxID=644358 RepID=A0A0C4DXN1_MAGP6|nr:hypothetical protein MAPG_04785 [Magnaporthiopsis poae ATCC 64411]